MCLAFRRGVPEGKKELVYMYENTVLGSGTEHDLKVSPPRLPSLADGWTPVSLVVCLAENSCPSESLHFPLGIHKHTPSQTLVETVAHVAPSGLAHSHSLSHPLHL